MSAEHAERLVAVRVLSDKLAAVVPDIVPPDDGAVAVVACIDCAMRVLKVARGMTDAEALALVAKTAADMARAEAVEAGSS